MSVLMRKPDLVRRYCCVLQVLESSVDLINDDRMVSFFSDFPDFFFFWGFFRETEGFLTAALRRRLRVNKSHMTAFFPREEEKGTEEGGNWISGFSDKGGAEKTTNLTWHKFCQSNIFSLETTRYNRPKWRIPLFVQWPVSPPNRWFLMPILVVVWRFFFSLLLPKSHFLLRATNSGNSSKCKKKSNTLFFQFSRNGPLLAAPFSFSTKNPWLNAFCKKKLFFCEIECTFPGISQNSHARFHQKMFFGKK